MSQTDERAALCALNRIFGYRPVLGHGLIRTAGSPAAVFSLKNLQIPQEPDLAGKVTQEALDQAGAELERLREKGFRFIGYGEEGYPPLLAECPDPPLGLYLNGTTPPAEVFGSRPSVAVVGTRDVSSYGREWCRRIVEAFSDARIRPLVVSGLAFGTDGIAHQTALEEGLPTVGVMATGIDTVYPFRHTALAVRIVGTRGCALVTDYPPGTAPLAPHFIRRNRIIAGLCGATVVVESRSRGGSLITAKYACDYDRDVYALPGRVDDVRSEGCNSLIRTRMADIITTPEDLADRLGLQPGRRRNRKGLLDLLTGRYGPDAPATRLALLVREHRGATFAELARLTGWSWSEVSRTAAVLEGDGILETDVLQRCSINGKNS